MVGGAQYISLVLNNNIVPIRTTVDSYAYKQLINAKETGKPVIIDVDVVDDQGNTERLIVPLSSELFTFPHISRFYGRTINYNIDITLTEIKALLQIKKTE